MIKLSRKLFTFIFLLFLSCLDVEKKEKDALENYLEILNVDTNNTPSLYLFLPHTTCGSCMQNVLEYLNTFHVPEAISLTAIFIGTSQKELEIMAKDLSTSINIVYDSGGLGYKKDIIMYSTPVIYKKYQIGTSEIVVYDGEKNPKVIIQQIESFINAE